MNCCCHARKKSEMFYKKIYSKRIEKSAICIGCILVLAFACFWCVFPIYTFDSSWYLSYLDYFTGAKPLEEWFAGRGFTFPLILWLAYLIKPGSLGVEMILCFFYMISNTYLYRIYGIVKQECFKKKLNLLDCIIVGVLIIFNPILWGYAHVLLTEYISIAGLVFYIYYALRFFFLRMKEQSKWTNYVSFLIFSCVMTILLWFLKQSFFVNTVLISAILETWYIIYKPHIKRIAYMVLMLVSMLTSISVSTSVWYNSIGVTDDTFAGGLAYRICALRYFYPENENTVSGSTVKISVMNDSYEEIDSFTYTFEDSIINRVQYVGTCFVKYPGRVLQGWLDNYMCMADIFRLPLAESGEPVWAYGNVVRKPIETICNNTGVLNICGEHRSIVLSNLSQEFNSSERIESHIDLLKSVNGYSDILLLYNHVNVPNFMSKLMSNEYLWDITIVNYAVLLVAAPWVFFYGVWICLGRKDKVEWAVYTVLSGYAWGEIMMHVLTGQPIDRYALPAYMAMLILEIIILVKMVDWFGHRKERSELSKM